MIEHRDETLLEKWVREYEKDPNFVAEGLATDVMEQVISKLEERNVNQTWLANAIHVQRQQISRMFNAPPNLTLLSLARLAVALRTKPRILFDSEAYSIRPLTETYDWEDFKTDQASLRAVRSSANTASALNLIGDPNAAA